MQKPQRRQTAVLPGGEFMVADQDLTECEFADIFSTASSPTPLDIVAESPGHRLFKTAQDVAHHLETERASWDH